MSTVESLAGQIAPPARTRPRESSVSWPMIDRVGLALCWAAGLFLVLVAGGLVLFMFVKGIQYLRPALLFEHPTGDVNQAKAGGFLDPLEGTLALTVIGTLIAAPAGVGVGVWLAEFGRPAKLARVVESGVDVIAGIPSIVLAICGLIVFSQGAFSFLSFQPTGAAAFGRSYLIAGLVVSLVALPLIVGSTREALLAVPNHVREASYALGKTKTTTIRSILLPAVRPGIATGVALGMGRIIGDTAVAIVLLGATLQNQGAGGLPGLSFLRGTGSTLTTYVYGNSPAGEGGAPQKAYAAAFVLLLAVLALNYLVDRLTRGGRGAVAWTR